MIDKQQSILDLQQASCRDVEMLGSP